MNKSLDYINNFNNEHMLIESDSFLSKSKVR